MNGTERKDQLYVFLFLTGVLLLLSPLLQAIDFPGLFLGVPVSFFYVFGVWAMIILFVALASTKSRRTE